MVRAYIYLTRSCNLSCAFCASDDTTQTHTNIKNINNLYSFLHDVALKTERLVISGGEPTLHPELARVLRVASQLFKTIELMTNGLRFVDRDFLAEILSAGLTDVCIPVASPDPIINDRINGRKGAFQMQLEGLSNLLVVPSPGKPRVHLKTIVVNQAIQTFPSFRSYFDRLPALPDFFIINGLHLGKKVLNASNLMPDPVLAGSFVSDLLVSIGGLSLPLAVAEFPLCLLSVDALEILTRTGFPIGAQGVDSIVYDAGSLSEWKSSHIKLEFCHSQCIAKDLCDGLPAKNFDAFPQPILNLLRPIVE